MVNLTPVPGATPRYDHDGNEIVVVATCGHCGRSWNDAATSAVTPVPSGRCPFEAEHKYEVDPADVELLKASVRLRSLLAGVPEFPDDVVLSDAQVRALAEKQYGSDAIEIDDDAAVSRSEAAGADGEVGAFVAAWVWVSFEGVEPS